jgi:hypothetical protein
MIFRFPNWNFKAHSTRDIFLLVVLPLRGSNFGGGVPPCFFVILFVYFFFYFIFKIFRYWWSIFLVALYFSEFSLIFFFYFYIYIYNIFAIKKI